MVRRCERQCAVPARDRRAKRGLPKARRRSWWCRPPGEEDRRRPTSLAPRDADDLLILLSDPELCPLEQPIDDVVLVLRANVDYLHLVPRIQDEEGGRLPLQHCRREPDEGAGTVVEHLQRRPDGVPLVHLY